MDEKKKNVPKRRFKEFKNADAWEQHELGKNSEIAAGGTPKTTELSYWNPEEIPWMSSGEINNRRINRTEKMISQLGYKRSSATWIPKKSVLIALAGQGKTRGMVAVNEIPLTTNQSIAAIIPKEKLYYEFIYQNLLSRYEELRLISSGDGSRGGLNKQIISSIFISSPSIKEQQIIGDFFKNIDDTITLHQRKLEKYKAIKESYLKEMFPAEGQRKPKRRFPGFTDDWEQRELGEVCNISTGKSNTQDKIDNGIYPFYVISSIIEKSTK
ncbi:restriction endonuclease subunit S [Macrococcoides caseolyticum]|uniref:restriction endonuclease subunit S n=1 Tax=Macrococcoides caseolyticum TaxID=69966 RepID=UPI001C5DAA5A|nr:restriction endonuclease subunit S [Macrococcus caseolyticus]